MYQICTVNDAFCHACKVGCCMKLECGLQKSPTGFVLPLTARANERRRADHKFRREVASRSRQAIPPAAVDTAATALFANKRFKCTECGKCCTGEGEVWVSEAECEAIADNLHISTADFLTQYCKSHDKGIPGWHVLTQKNNADKVRLGCFAYRACVQGPLVHISRPAANDERYSCQS